MEEWSLRTFLSANTSEGFFSYYKPFLANKTTYIVKGGPGTGKSSLMKKIAASAFHTGHNVEYIYCSSDPNSLDGVYISDLQTTVCDGTSPHLADPEYPGSEGGIVNLGECWNEKLLRNSRNDIRSLNETIKNNFERAYRYLSAAGCAYNDVKKLAANFLQEDRLETFTKAFIKKKIIKKSGVGTKEKRFLSAFSPKGYVTLKDTIYSAKTVYVFDDKFGLFSVFLEKFATEAVKAGYLTYIFYNPLAPRCVAHILIPEINIALATSDKLTDFIPQNANCIHISRFLTEDVMYIKTKTSFALKLMKACIDEALKSIELANRLHDDIEDIYISAMDFEKVNQMTASLMTKIFTNP